ncbi:hypothetical protein FXB41_28030 [Bradyrhizobium canariense]|uniref:hypothetical protein n=1 Tax=Bradyrhizobium canariense TaxID=255045 RepID=UPI001CA4B789|nr:hypothetical protein [Bradyrhizobium canariense]MBW5438472.1 hypothetical protein [Bradyrhizobium canariense]
MPPFDLKQQKALSDEFRRMEDEWFSKWQNIQIEGYLVDVDDFSGGRIHVDRNASERTIQRIYWQSLDRHLANGIHRAMERWDVETAHYPEEQRRLALVDLSEVLRHHVKRVGEKARQVHYRLPDIPEILSRSYCESFVSTATTEINRLEKAHLTLLDGMISAQKAQPPPAPQPKASVMRRFNAFLYEWKGVIGLVTAVIGVIGMVFKLLGFV